ncbi:Metallo-dependent phosphatase-like protein [Sporodiniella umbellata]|nr:Metallo-dependent phosphatase-like protein [Sporodiniella umbellata]
MTLLELIHFNDVYHVTPSKEEPVGGASRFTTKINEIRSRSEQTPLVLFSGDAFNPSLEGTVTRGSHMPEILNQLSISAACLGNHDFDFGMPQLGKLIGQTQFPWLLSNVLNEGEPAGSFIHRFLVIEQEGLRIGLIGLVEKEWILTIPSFPPELSYHDFVQVAKDLSRELRDPEGPHRVDLIIALTHMRVPNDFQLAEACQEEVDLILGGHDHFYYVSRSITIAGQTWSRDRNLIDVGFDPEQGIEEGKDLKVVKSGTDFREFSYLRLVVEKDASGKRRRIEQMTAERIVVDSKVAVDAETERLVEKVTALVATKTNVAIGYTTVPLDGRSMCVRTEESNLGNLTADLMVMYYQMLPEPAEIGFCVGGTIRNDGVIEPGEVTFGDILTAFPFSDPVVVIQVTGQQLWDALENSVSEYPKQEGRFPQLANIRLEWNPNGAPGNRVRKVYTVRQTAGTPQETRSLAPLPYHDRERYAPENMDPLCLEREYSVATRSYLVGGYDGYEAFKVAKDKIVVDDESGVMVSTLYRRFFLGLKYINAYREYHAAHRSDHVRRKVASIAAYWKQVATQFKRHHHPEDGRECDCETDSSDGHTFLNSAIQDRAHYHTSRKSITDAFLDSGKGHPECIVAEDEEEKMETQYDQNQQEPWVKRWCSISPQVEAETYQGLCKVPGKTGGGEYDARVDSPTGEKYQVMKPFQSLGDHLGLPGIPAADILSKMGKPSEMTALLDQDATLQTMPGRANDSVLD